MRHFDLDWAFLRFTDFKRRKYSPPPSPPCNVVPLFELPIENNKRPNFEWMGQGRGVDSLILWSYPSLVQCLNNFVADCSFNRYNSYNRNNRNMLWLNRKVPQRR